MTGAARPTAAQKGRSIDLNAAIKAKMEHAFGDLSAVKFYESQAVGDAGAEAIAQGNEIAFAPGMADFSSRSGQERLGHELSHVMSQRSEQVRGAGFLASASLEVRADREGAMAAAGEQVYTGPVNHALSNASPSPSAAEPMQASRGNRRTWQEEYTDLSNQRDASLHSVSLAGGGLSPQDEKRRQTLNKKHWKILKKRMSNFLFYDKVESILSSKPGDVPKFAKSWFQKHFKNGSRDSGQKGWGDPRPTETTYDGQDVLDDDLLI